MPPPTDDANESRRDRLIVGAALVLLAASAWAYTAHHAMMMAHMDHAAMRSPGSMAGEILMLLVMWIAMMVAMMTPAIGPMVTAFATINRRRRARAEPSVGTAFFVAGYIVAWSLFCIPATAAHVALSSAGLLDPTMAQTSRYLSAALFLLAGLYQWSPLKDLCLTRCRSTDGFILSEWRDGRAGAVVMGLRHGLYCIGCCAPLMALLFAVSVMNLAWVAALTVLVMIEKLLPRPQVLRRVIGAGLIVAAVYFVIAAPTR